MAWLFTLLVVFVVGVQWLHLGIRQRHNERTRSSRVELQVFGLALAFLVAAIMCGVSLLEKNTVPFHVAAWALIGASIGAGLRIAAIERIGRGFSWGSTAPDDLITDGVYRFVKHPLIVGYILETVALTLVGQGTSWLKISVIALVLCSGAAQIRKEERVLRAAFGQRWDAFAKARII